MDGSLLVPLVLVAVLSAIYWYNRQAREAREYEAYQAAEHERKRLATAQREYEESLRKLKTDPANPDLKQRTLQLGRTYSAMTREQKAVTVYDEMALSNDISAAAAAAAVQPPAQVYAAPAQPTHEDRLRKLADLQAQGLITDQEYVARRQQILDSI